MTLVPGAVNSNLHLYPVCAKINNYSHETEKNDMIKLGEYQTLTVCKLEKQGVYLSDGGEDSVLLPSNQVPADCKKGDSIEVFLYKDSEDRQIATTSRPAVTLHKAAILTVKEVTNIGAFLDWGLAKDLLLPFKEQTYKVQEGDRVLVALYEDKTGRLCATMQVYNYLSTDSPYHKDDKVTGILYQYIENFGAYVAVDEQFSAMVPKKDLHHQPKIGETVTLRVAEVLDDGKLTLAFGEKIKEQMSADAQLILECLETAGGFLPYHDKTSPDVIAREFDLSKAAFKRAIGQLYKQRKITITKEGIQLEES